MPGAGREMAVLAETCLLDVVSAPATYVLAGPVLPGFPLSVTSVTPVAALQPVRPKVVPSGPALQAGYQSETVDPLLIFLLPA